MTSFLDASGKLVVVGYANTGGKTGEDVAVLRYNLAGAAPGTLDATFGKNGIVTTQIMSSDVAYDAALAPDGNIVVVGQSTPGKGNSSFNQHDSFAVRYTGTGSLDKGFGGGIITADLGGLYDAFMSVLVQPDKKVVAAGGYEAKLVRYTATGKLDSSFGTGGVLHDVFNQGSYSTVTDVAIQHLGGADKILAAGVFHLPNTTEDYALARFNLNGTPDTSFDGDGRVTTDFGSADLLLAAAVHPTYPANSKLSPLSNCIVTTGYFDEAPAGYPKSLLALARYLPNGSLDTSFGDGDGFINPDLNMIGEAVAIQSDGMVVVAGDEAAYATWNASSITVARFDVSGNLDTSFGDFVDSNQPSLGRTGKAVLWIPGYVHGEVESVVIQTDGKIVITGWASDGTDNPPYYYAPRVMVVARYNPDGTLDSTFGDSSLAATVRAQSSPSGFLVDAVFAEPLSADFQAHENPSTSVSSAANHSKSLDLAWQQTPMWAISPATPQSPANDTTTILTSRSAHTRDDCTVGSLDSVMMELSTVGLMSDWLLIR
ncbi:MAG: hypothetical protein MUF48_21785 [Pirellulaceae bacterium]|nr:hypothetical protein [Pirellulaceae bacterium]